VLHCLDRFPSLELLLLTKKPVTDRGLESLSQLGVTRIPRLLAG
jgi:hypothetical protein